MKLSVPPSVRIFDQGFPAYYPEARAFVVLHDPGQQQFLAGEDTVGEGTALNVRALYQRCPHLGCKPNPCLKNFWFECPCHGSRYDRLGQKALGAQYGPAPRSMDRFAAKVDSDGTLTLDTTALSQQLAQNPTAVSDFFLDSGNGFAAKLKRLISGTVSSDPADNVQNHIFAVHAFVQMTVHQHPDRLGDSKPSLAQSNGNGDIS